jgi:hypothetical protein
MEKVISLDSIKTYFIDVEKHQDELIQIQRKERKNEIEEHEAERQNTQCLLLFHEKLTNFLKYCNIRILTQEERRAEIGMEHILNQILSV